MNNKYTNNASHLKNLVTRHLKGFKNITMSIKTNETAKHTSLIFSARPSNYFLKTSMQEQRNSSVLKIKSSKCQSHATLISQNLKKQTSNFTFSL